MIGSVALAVTDADEPGPLPPEAERIEARHRAFAGTPADDFPRAAAAAVTRAGYISTEQYLWGLHRLLDGVTHMGTAVDHRQDGHRRRLDRHPIEKRVR